MEMKSLKEYLRHFEFLVNNSKEFIVKQVDAYRQQTQKLESNIA